MPKEKKGTDDKRKDFTAPSRSINKINAVRNSPMQDKKQDKGQEMERNRWHVWSFTANSQRFIQVIDR